MTPIPLCKRHHIVGAGLVRVERAAIHTIAGVIRRRAATYRVRDEHVVENGIGPQGENLTRGPNTGLNASGLCVAIARD